MLSSLRRICAVAIGQHAEGAAVVFFFSLGIARILERRIELADAAPMDAVNRYSKIDLPVAPILWMGFHGTEASVAE